MTTTITLFRPIGPAELTRIAESGYTRFPPRLPGQPIFYPVTNEQYAIQIARDWNVKESGAGFVTRFDLDATFAAKYPVQRVGAAMHEELWVPAEDLEELNIHIVGKIEILHRFGPGGELPVELAL